MVERNHQILVVKRKQILKIEITNYQRRKQKRTCTAKKRTRKGISLFLPNLAFSDLIRSIFPDLEARLPRRAVRASRLRGPPRHGASAGPCRSSQPIAHVRNFRNYELEVIFWILNLFFLRNYLDDCGWSSFGWPFAEFQI